MTDITIPREALEAAMKAVIAYLMFDVEPDARANQLTTDEHTNVARAACLAMLKNWPGMHLGHQCIGCGGDPQIILPLTENKETDWGIPVGKEEL